MQMRQSLAQKTWAKWENVRDKFSPNQLRLILFCLLLGFLLAFTTGEKKSPQKTITEEPKRETTKIEKEPIQAPVINKVEEPKEEPISEPLPQTRKPIWPVEGRITRDQGWYRSDGGDWRYHSGVDIAVPQGTVVQAAMGGTVVEAGQNASLGQFLKTEQDGTVLIYGHLSSISVKVGETVNLGETIALSGKSGDAEQAAVHFGVYSGGQAQDPKLWLEAF